MTDRYKIIRNKWHPLSRIDEGESALYRALYELEPSRPGSIGELIKVYRAAGMDDLKPATRVDYSKILLRLDHHFGKMRLGALKSVHISVWLEKRRKAGKGAVRANREFAVLSSVHKFGMRHKERPRSRAVTNAEFLEAFEAANEPFQDLIAAAYLSGARQTDVVSWTRSGCLRPEGIVYVQSKTRKPHTIEWSDALRFFVRRAMARFPEGGSRLLEHPGTALDGLRHQ